MKLTAKNLLRTALVLIISVFCFFLRLHTPTSISYSHDGKSIAVGFPSNHLTAKGNAEVIVYDQQSASKSVLRHFYFPSSGGVVAVHFSNNDRSLYGVKVKISEVDRNNSLCRFDVSGNTENTPVCIKGESKADKNEEKYQELMAISRLLNADSLRPESAGKTNVNLNYILARATATDNRLSAYVIGYPDQELLIYDRSQQKIKAIFTVNKTVTGFNDTWSNVIYNIAWSADGHHIAAGYNGGIVKIWDWRKAHLEQIISSAYRGYVVPLYSQNGKHLVVGDQLTGSLSIYDAWDYSLTDTSEQDCGQVEFTGSELHGLEMSPQRFAISPDSKKVAITCKNDYVETDIHDSTSRETELLAVSSHLLNRTAYPSIYH